MTPSRISVLIAVVICTGLDRSQAIDTSQAPLGKNSVLDSDSVLDSRAVVELHGVSIDKGYDPDGIRPAFGETREGLASVRVDRPGQRVILFLSSGARTAWSVELSQGTRLERVIFGGDHEQSLAAPLVGVRIDDRTRAANRRTAISGLTGRMPSPDVLAGNRVVAVRPALPGFPDRAAARQAQVDYDFTQAAAQIHQLTGLSLITFTAQPTVRPDAQIVIRGPQAWSLDNVANGELHAVSLNRGWIAEDQRRTSGAHRLTRATVHVDRPGKVVLLFLSARARTEWDVEVSEATTLKGIILGGFFVQSTAHDRDGTMVLARSLVDNSHDGIPGTYGLQPTPAVRRGERRVATAPTNQDEALASRSGRHLEFQQRQTDFRYAQTRERLKAITGVECTSFVIQQSAMRDRPIIIGSD